jgi:hypothetical protein
MLNPNALFTIDSNTLQTYQLSINTEVDETNYQFRKTDADFMINVGSHTDSTEMFDFGISNPLAITETFLQYFLKVEFN